MATEKINFEINLSSKYWDIVPYVKVRLDGSVLFQGEIKESISIARDLVVNEGEHKIEVILINKDGRRDTILENGNITKDMLVTVDSVIIDDIDIGYIISSMSNYVTEDGIEHTKMTSLGWNGVWSLSFTSPVYMWLLENL